MATKTKKEATITQKWTDVEDGVWVEREMEVTISVGDEVEFKYDIEQVSVVKDIRRNRGGYEFLVTATEGGYVQGPTDIWVEEERVWV